MDRRLTLFSPPQSEIKDCNDFSPFSLRNPEFLLPCIRDIGEQEPPAEIEEDFTALHNEFSLEEDTNRMSSPIQGTLEFISPFRAIALEHSQSTCDSCTDSGRESPNAWKFGNMQLPTLNLDQDTEMDIGFSSFVNDVKTQNRNMRPASSFPSLKDPAFHSLPTFVTKSAEFTPSQKKRSHLLLSPEADMDDDIQFMEQKAFIVLVENKSERYFIVDTRYGYEYDGGHFHEAMHLPYRHQIDVLFERVRLNDCTIIFHCEKSLVRGPRACRYFQDLMRKNNLSTSTLRPVVLRGGYSEFYRKHPVKTKHKFITPVGWARELEKSFTLKKRAAREKVNKTWKQVDRLNWRRSCSLGV